VVLITRGALSGGVHDGNMSSRTDAETIRVATQRSTSGALDAVGVTILWHPDPSRVGDVATLLDTAGGGPALLSRTAPCFRNASGPQTGDLETATISRSELLLRGDPDGSVHLDGAWDVQRLEVDGAPVDGPTTFQRDALRSGVVLELGRTVALLLHTVGIRRGRDDELGIVGQSAAIRALRRDIHKAAQIREPVLVRGETGSGKELVARALHQLSPRRRKPLVIVNGAALSSGVAESQLFGHAEGAFTGATTAHEGFFAQADGGTLFLDEIGDLAETIQPKLLRVLEAGDLQPVGSRTRHVDVRVITATDRPLEQAVREGKFRLPLLKRLTGCELVVPPLRERRDDVGRLFWHFLQRELGEVSPKPKWAPTPRETRIPSAPIARLALHDWPGNVRELETVVRELVRDNLDQDVLHWSGTLSRLLQRDGVQSTPPRATRSPKSNSDSTIPPPPSIRRAVATGAEHTTGDAAFETRGADPKTRRTDRELLISFETHGFELARTARALGMNKGWLIQRLKQAGWQPAADLGISEITAALEQCASSVEHAAQRLRVSTKALRSRMTSLGITAR